MGPVSLLAAPIRRIASSRLIQLAAVVAVILLLDHYSNDYAPLQAIAEGLNSAVTATVRLCSEFFRIGILTDPMLQVALMIVYVYAICLLAFVLLRIAMRKVIDLVGRNNVLWLRNTIARERGIAAYEAWLPLERIRPADCPQDQWEQQYAWPPDNKPPYPPMGQRIARGVIVYALVLIGMAIVLQVFTPFPVFSWLERLI